jgi:hypothetical protein
LKWYFTGFCDAVSSKLRYVEPLPKKPYFPMMQNGVNFNPEWPIRVNAEHILSDPENRERLPKKLLRFKNLPLLLETAVELGRRKAVIEPGLVVPQGYQNQLQFLLPICLTDMEKPNLAMTLAERNGYYLGSTCLTLEMAYLNARMIARPIAPWLTSLVKK